MIFQFYIRRSSSANHRNHRIQSHRLVQNAIEIFEFRYCIEVEVAGVGCTLGHDFIVSIFLNILMHCEHHKRRRSRQSCCVCALEFSVNEISYQTIFHQTSEFVHSEKNQAFDEFQIEFGTYGYKQGNYLIVECFFVDRPTFLHFDDLIQNIFVIVRVVGGFTAIFFSVQLLF